MIQNEYKITIATETTIKVVCTCGTPINEGKVQYRPDGPVIVVKPCPTCLEDAREDN